MNSLDFTQLLQKYGSLITNDLMRFWQRAFDTENGGVYTCYSNSGDELLSSDKYVWSQGRMLWVLSRLCEMHDRGLLLLPRAEYEAQARKTRDFLQRCALLPQEGGVCAYLLAENGEKKESIPGKGFYTSYFVDCFVIMGFMEFARVFHDKDAAVTALGIFKGMTAYLDRGEIRSEPYPVRRGLRPHSKAMILCNVCGVCAKALEELGLPQAREFRDRARGYAHEILYGFYSAESGVLHEMLGGTPEEQGSVLLRHIAPGHGNESMWFCMDAYGDSPEVLEGIYGFVEQNMRRGWDEEQGGVFRFCDYEGGRPRGTVLGDPYETLVLETWDTKLWWVHAETLYTLLRCYVQSGRPAFAQWFLKTQEYVFSHFPNPNREVGEWVQILNRAGQPLNKMVALPVKDPFHILRDAMLMVELLYTAVNTGETTRK